VASVTDANVIVGGDSGGVQHCEMIRTLANAGQQRGAWSDHVTRELAPIVQSQRGGRGACRNDARDI
jgi:hypothetical protein